MNSKIALAFIACSILFVPKAFARCANIVAFPAFAELSQNQQKLLNEFMPEVKTTFAAWSTANDGLATEFLANTHALERLYLQLPDGSYTQAIHLIDHINHIEGDRMKVTLNSELFNQWRNAGANFKVHTFKGKIESGHFRFNHGDLGGSLHHGYDMQGYSSVTKVPRFQINYRFSDNEADMDLDGFQPWIGGIIPNPHHLTWNNSDPRCWLSKFEKKFGSLFLDAR